MDQKVDGELHLRISGPIWPQRAYMLALAMIYNSNGALRIQFEIGITLATVGIALELF